MFADNFVRVSRGVLIDPVLRVTMQAGRFDLGTSEQVIRLLYDPEIRPDRLTQPLTPQQERMQRMLGSQGDATTAFESPRARHLVDFIFLLSRDRGVSELRLLTTADHLPTLYQLLTTLGPPDVANDPRGFLRYVLSAVVRLESWDEWTSGPDATRLTLLVRAEVYRALVGPHTGATEPDGYVMIHSRNLMDADASRDISMSCQQLELRLATDIDRREFDRETAGMLRAGQFDALDAFLREQLAGLRGSIAEAARATTAEAVRIDGWDLVNRECARRLAASSPISAIGLNLSNYNESSTSVWHDKEPAIEFAVYGNDAFDFRHATIEEILRVSETPPTPWQGRMIGPDPPIVPTLSGLRSLNSALLEYENENPWRPSHSSDGAAGAAPEGYVAFALGQWTLHLRFHQAVVRHMKQVGLPVAVPVLIGEHDVLPFIRSVVMPEKLIDGESSTRLQHVLNKDEPSDAASDAHIAELDALRRTIQGLGFFSRRRRQGLIEQSEARESQVLQSVGLAWPRRTWTMSDSQFAAFAHAFGIAYQVSKEPTEPRSGKR